MLAKGERPKPWLNYRRGGGLHDAADHNAVGEHVIVVIVPLAGQARAEARLRTNLTSPSLSRCAVSLDHLVGARQHNGCITQRPSNSYRRTTQKFGFTGTVAAAYSRAPRKILLAKSLRI